MQKQQIRIFDAGLPRGCDFCIVESKEGRQSRKVADLPEFWNGQKNIVLLDPNFFACREWKELAKQLIDSRAWVDFSQGVRHSHNDRGKKQRFCSK